MLSDLTNRPVLGTYQRRYSYKPVVWLTGLPVNLFTLTFRGSKRSKDCAHFLCCSLGFLPNERPNSCNNTTSHRARHNSLNNWKKAIHPPHDDRKYDYGDPESDEEIGLHVDRAFR